MTQHKESQSQGTVYLLFRDAYKRVNRMSHFIHFILSTVLTMSISIDVAKK